MAIPINQKKRNQLNISLHTQLTISAIIIFFGIIISGIIAIATELKFTVGEPMSFRMTSEGRIIENTTPRSWNSWIYRYIIMRDETMSSDYSFFQYYLFRYIWISVMFSGPLYLLCYQILQLFKAVQKISRGGEDRFVYNSYL
ncbi:uncharacterized protein LOC105276006 [Ooceraea biroi]|uniref:uncharacterized protein LOC105276006 n=1 Tax=Ooceraea biroi TaxID=2015173 RepID=UPI000F093B68|nr:uncharacterized protein LOC105276006 [Ooceraea biroi]